MEHTDTIGRSYDPKVRGERMGKDKRSLENDECSDDIFVTNVKKDLTDYDYRNGNAEPDSEDQDLEADEVKNVNKRETEVVKGKEY